MKRSSLILISILVLLSALAIYLYKTKAKPSTVTDIEDRKFAVKDTAAIGKIFIADKEGNSSNIVRTKDGWYVNDKFKCRADAILNLLEIIKNVDVKMPVQKSAHEETIKLLAGLAYKVEIYNKENELIKQYYIGHETQDYEGSFMLLTDIEKGENFKTPYICHLPGFKGYLKPRYICKENDWRSQQVIALEPTQLKQIKLEYQAYRDSGFVLDLIDTKTFKLSDLNGKPLNATEANLKQFLAYFQNLSYEGLISSYNKRFQDSLLMNQPFCKLTIEQRPFKTNVYKFYRKEPPKHMKEDKKSTFTFDPDRFYLVFEGDKQFAIAQYFIFGKVLVTPPYFVKAN
jgi:hypothetical protein